MEAVFWGGGVSEDVRGGGGVRDTDGFDSLHQEINAAMARLHVPGVALGVIHGERQHSAGFGVTNVEHPLPVDAGTLFQIGSITKTVTATAIMRYVEQGRLALDAPLRTYLPELRLADEDTAARVTPRHLLTHTAGWVGDYFDDSGPGDDALARSLTKLAGLPQLTPVGEVWSYNNAGFYLAGRLLEVVGGRPYEQLIRELVLEPLEMQRSFFFAAEAITHRVAAGHEAVYGAAPAQPAVARPWGLSRSGNALGGLVCSVNDLLRYAHFHLHGGPLLRAETLAQMHAPRVPAANGDFMGVAWFIREVDGVRVLRHGGATNGQAATLVLVPAHNFALALLTNSDRGDELHRALARRALALYPGLQEADPQPIAASADQLAPLPGEYRAAANILTLYLQAGELWLQDTPRGGFPTPDSPPPPAPPPVRAALCGVDRLLLLDPPRQGGLGEFLRGPDGSLAWLRLGGRIHARVRA